jgi:hypothetical protein
MTKPATIPSLVICALGLSAGLRAAPQAGSGEVKQKVSRAAIRAATYAQVHYVGPPHFTYLEGTPITYATNTVDAVIKSGDAFYFRYAFYNPVHFIWQDAWLISRSPEGPWMPAHLVPVEVENMVCSQINDNPNQPYQVCALPWPY